MQKKTLLVIIALILIGVGGYFLVKGIFSRSSGKAVLEVDSTPSATVFLNGEKIGNTPYKDEVTPGKYTLKLIPESTTVTAISWESEIITTAGQLTYVNRSLGDSELTSAGEVLYLEKIGGKKMELTVLSSPDAADVSLSGESKGTTPLLLSDLKQDSYDLTVSKSGYKARSVKIKIIPGFKITASFQLAITGEIVASPEPTPEPDESPKSTPKASATPKATSKAQGSPPPKPYVEILETPVGFLRVRADNSTSSEEVGRVNPGEFYSLLDENNGWYKIEYEEGKEGWISGQYAEKFE